MGETTSHVKRWITGELAGTTEAGGVSQTVGHDIVSAINYSGADVSTNLANAAASGGTLASPDGWTDLVDFDIGTPITVFVKAYSAVSKYPLYVNIDSSEDAGDGVRVQFLVDDTVIWDQTVVKDATDQSIQCYGTPDGYSFDDGGYIYFNCQDNFKIRATRLGTFANADTDLYLGQTHYVKYQ